MQVRKANNSPFGIERVFTSNMEKGLFPILFPPSNKPYIIFELPYCEESIKYVRKTTLARFGKIKENYIDENNNKKITLTVTGNHKIKKVIKIFLSHTLYPKEDNLALRNHLLTFKKECKKRYLQKPRRPLPLKTKSSSSFKILKEIGTNSTNKTYLAEKVNNPNKKYVFKENISGRKIPMYEAYNTWCYRLLLNDRHPKATVVPGKKGEISGLLIEYIEGFESFYDRYSKFFKTVADCDRPTEKELLDSKIIQCWASAYLHYEWDQHGDNFGFKLDGLSVKVDGDQSNFPLTWVYTDYTPRIISASFTRHDIISFPLVNDRKIENPPINDVDRLITREMILRLRNHKIFMEDMYYIFLKYILIPRDVYEAIGKATIGSPKHIAPYVNLTSKSTIEFREIILKIPPFREYLKNNPHIIDKIIEDFKKYNDDFKKPRDHYLHVNLEVIAKNFNNILEKVSNNSKAVKKQISKNTANTPSPPHTFPSENLPIRKRSIIRKYPIAAGIMIGAFSTIGIALVIAGIIFSGGLFSVPMLAPVASFLAPAATTLTVVAKAAVLGIAAKITSLATGTVVTTATVALNAPVVGTVAAALGSAFAVGMSGLGGFCGFIAKKIMQKKKNSASKMSSLAHTSNLNLSTTKNDSPKLPTVFNQSLNKAIKARSAIIKSNALNAYSLYQPKPNQKDLEKVNRIVEFLYAHIDFFIAPFENPQNFKAWIEEEPQNLDQLTVQESAKALSKDLLKVLANKEPQKLKEKKQLGSLDDTLGDNRPSEKELMLKQKEHVKKYRRELYALKHNKELLPEFIYYQEALLGEKTIYDTKEDKERFKTNKPIFFASLQLNPPTPITGLVDGNCEPIKELLLRNIKLRHVLTKHLENPAIKAWYNDHQMQPRTVRIK